MSVARTVSRWAIGVGVLWTGLPAAASVTWYVDAANAGDPAEDGSAAHPFDRVQDGIVAATGGDQVLVLPGLYPERLDFLGKAITVESRDGAADTIIDGQTFPGEIVAFRTGEGRSSVLRGFTLRGGEGHEDGPLFGGGIYCFETSPTIAENIIVSNRAHFGGGISCERSNPAILDNFISGNEVRDSHRHLAGDGAGIFIYNSSAEIRGNVIIANQARRTGGGIGIYGGDVGESYPMDILLANTLIADNVVLDNGGGALYVDIRAVVTATGCTMDGNTAPLGGGVFVQRQFATVNLANSILYGNTGGLVAADLVVGTGGIVSVSYSDVEGGQGGAIVSPTGSLTWGAGNIAADPLVVGPTDRRLRPCSPCVNAGDPAYVPAAGETDAGGAGRVFGSRIDMGAHELVYHDCGGNGVPDECECAADLNHDCAVSLTDLTTFLAHFGTPSGATDADGDLDGDGDVDLSDLTLLLAQFGQSCP